MKLSSVIFYLGLFSLFSGLIGFIYWASLLFLILIYLGAILNFFSIFMENHEL